MSNNSQKSETPIEKNSFAIIDATTRDDKKRILELAEEKSFSADPDLCSKARSDLTNPRNRLSAEISWLPCVSPKRTKELLKILKEKPDALLGKLEIEPLARANLMASAMEVIEDGMTSAEWSKWILTFSQTFEQIDADKTLRHINEDRAVSGFPEITDIALVKKELSERRHVYNESIKQALNRLPTAKLLDVITTVVDISTKSGTQHAAHLIDDIVDKYQIETEGHLQSGAEKIEKLIEGAKKVAAHGEKEMLPVIEAIEKSVRDWDKVAQPIQLSFKSRGLDHDLSVELGFKIRSLAVDIANDHGMLEPTARITSLLKDVFAELPEFSARLDDDIKTLDDLTEQKRVSDEIAPIIAICDEGIAAAEREPKQAEDHGQKLLKKAEDRLAEMSNSGLSPERVAAAKDYIAVALVECAVSYGNETRRWASCATLLEAAERLATNEMVLKRVKDNLAVVRKNDVLHGKPIGSAPSLSTINGIGFKLYGATDPDRESGSHIATYYFVFFFIPIFPIARYRVIERGNSYNFLGKFPLRNFDKWHLAISCILIAAFCLTNM